MFGIFGMPDQTARNILEFSRDLRMASTRLNAGEQAVITMMAMHRHHAGRHAIASTIVEDCTDSTETMPGIAGRG